MWCFCKHRTRYKMKENIIIIGASGYGKVVADIILQSGNNVFGFLDDNTEIGETFIGFPVLGEIDNYIKYPKAKYIVAIGNEKIREKIVDKLIRVSWYTAIHPKAIVSKIDTYIGEGSVIMASAVINAGAKIGKHCIINTGSIVEHDNKIEDFVHVSVGAKLAGNVCIGKKTWIGIGATVSNNIKICSDCIVGAGAVVVQDICGQGIYIGIPAKKYRE